ncbi:ABC transporter permease [Yinghuangia sp. YIM S09857]|uniref:ABC transporter permease n=1 Tax=Yinghuangia sp. YIM S09857 TaxID=3436929 RepID=UPI003F53C76E
MNLLCFVLRRTAGAIAVLIVLSAGVFAATEVLPGDAADVMAGVDAAPAQRAQLRAELGLDRPAADRYREWASGAVRGDLGTGTVGRRPVSDVVGARLPNSALLAGLALAVAAPLAVVLGLVAGMRAGGALDRWITTATQIAVGIPEFVTAGVLLAVLSVWLGALPRVSLVPLGQSPLQAPEALVLPVLTLSVVGLAAATRLIRATVADIRTAPYIESARLNGVRGVRLAVRHVLPGALAPAVQALALTTGGLVGGTVVVESVFGYPGIGNELQQAVAGRDVPMVQGIALTLCAVMLLSLLVGDVVARMLDPRARA